MEKKNDTIDLYEVFLVIWRHLFLIIAVSLACGAIGLAIATFLITPRYDASAKMIVNNSQDMSGINTVSNQDLTASADLVNTYAVILKSHDVLDQVATDLGLYYDYDTLYDMIDIKAVDNTQVMEIVVTDTSAQEALDIVTDIVALAPDAISKTVDVGSVSTVDTPFSTGERVFPRRGQFTAIGFIIGFLICCAIVIARELTNDKFRSEEDVTSYLGLTVLGVIPLEDESAKETRKARKRGNI